MAIVKGFLVGATMIVPGVSGGSMAMILGIYDRLISAVSTFWKNPKDNGRLLATFFVGGVIGAFLFSTPVSWLLDKFEVPTMYFFIGAVFGGLPLIEKKSQISKISFATIFYILIGAGGVLLISAIPEGVLQDNEGGISLLIAGIASAVALILPGISFSHFLLILGLYEELIRAIQALDVMFLFLLGIGILLGIILFSKILELAMRKFPQPTYLVIMGFILGSVAEIFPGIPEGAEIPVCVGLASAGFFLIKRLVDIE